MGFLVLPLLGASRTDYSQKQQVLEQHTRGTVHEDLNTYTVKFNQSTNQFSDAQEQ